MDALIRAFAGTMFTCMMTVLGAAPVLWIKNRKKNGEGQGGMGFAAGVMAAAAVFSLICPAAEQTEQMGGKPALMIALGFAAGAAMIELADTMLRRSRRMKDHTQEERRRLLMVSAITLHNIPEGMAVGLAFALAGTTAEIAAAAALALGIGIQNLPEGTAIALPLYEGGASRSRSFVCGALSGVVEPLFGCLTVLAAGRIRQMLPGMMAFAAGAMMMVVFGEMIPQAAPTKRGKYMIVLGYTAMMALDIALG